MYNEDEIVCYNLTYNTKTKYDFFKPTS